MEFLKTITTNTVPKLTTNLHKGQMGKIAVVGGSSQYSGAPYFAGMAALRMGADLCHIICSSSASTVIKSYSPELMVSGLLPDHNEICISTQIMTILRQCDCIIFGPGMGREDGMLGVVKELVIQCSKLNIPCVIDADALYMLSVHPEICDSLKCAVLTPNAMEYARLCSSVKLIADANVEEAIKIEPHVYLSKLKNAYVWMVLKGHRDTIAGAGVCSRYVDAFNSPKRCGGLGDIMAGCLGTMIAWHHRSEEASSHNFADVLFASAMVARKSAVLAFEHRKRAMSATDVLDQIGKSFNELLEHP